GKILRPGIDSGGYPLVVLCDKGGRGQVPLRVHHLVASAFHGQRPRGHECRHLNGAPSDCRAENLSWGTPKENGLDRILHGTAVHGERISGAKLTKQEAREICAWALEGSVSQKEIAGSYGVEQSRVSYIKSGRNWKRATADLRGSAQ